MKKHRILKRILAFLLMPGLLFSLASAEEYPLSAGGITYTVELPDGYLPYTPEMGADSPMVKAFGSDPSALNPYLDALGCSMVCAHAEQLHQMWISVKDRSAGFPHLPEGADPSPADLEAYYAGVSFSRGKYITETHNGHTYRIFADGESIFEGGTNCYISSFLGKNEVIVRWESGNGSRTDSDLEDLRGVIRSIIESASGDSEPSAPSEPSPEETPEPDSSGILREYAFPEVPAVLRLSEENLNICTQPVSPDSLTAKRLSEQDRQFMALEFALMDSVKAFICYPDTSPALFFIQVRIEDGKYPEAASWDRAEEAEISSMMDTLYRGQITSYSVYRTDTAAYTVFSMPFEQNALRYVTLKNGDLVSLLMRRQNGPLTDEDYELLKAAADSLEFRDQ